MGLRLPCSEFMAFFLWATDKKTSRTNSEIYEHEGRTLQFEGFEDVLLAGLATDGGLYLPQSWPQFEQAMKLQGLAGLPYPELAYHVIQAFCWRRFFALTNYATCCMTPIRIFYAQSHRAAGATRQPMIFCWSCFMGRRWHLRILPCNCWHA